MARRLQSDLAAVGRMERLLRQRENARPDPLPARVPLPQLALAAAQAPSGEPWIHEIKLDGYRMLARVERGNGRFFTRHRHEWSDRLPTLVDGCRCFASEELILGGELVALDEAGRSNFQALQVALGGPVAVPAADQQVAAARVGLQVTPEPVSACLPNNRDADDAVV